MQNIEEIVLLLSVIYAGRSMRCVGAEVQKKQGK
jgi:hypothetical protein